MPIPEEVVVKCVLVGDSGVGKTTWVEKLHKTHGAEEEVYIPTLGVMIYPLRFTTTQGRIRFNVWVSAKKLSLGELSPKVYAQADALIIMYDSSSRKTLKSLKFWKQEANTDEIIPTLIVGNKVDKKGREVTSYRPPKQFMRHLFCSGLKSFHTVSAFQILTSQLIGTKATIIEELNTASQDSELALMMKQAELIEMPDESEDEWL